MGTFRLIVGILRGIGFLVNLVFTGIFVVVAWFAVRSLVNSGELPADPFGLGATGLPETLLGLPITYAGGLLVFAAMMLFGGSGGSTTSDGGYGGGFGDGGGGGGDGGGGE
ncbi:MAG: hypothetical protein V5A44_04530 [Haloarculaceae archaeon]